MKQSKISIGLMILDFLVVFCLFIVFLYIQIPTVPKNKDGLIIFFHSQYKSMTLFLLSWILIAGQVQLYKISDRRRFFVIFKPFFYQIFLFSIVVFAVSGVKEEHLFSNLNSAYYILSVSVVILTIRVFYFLSLKIKNNFRKIAPKNIIIIGTNQNTQEVLSTLKKHENQYSLKEIVDTEKVHIFRNDDLRNYIEKNNVNQAYISLESDISDSIIAEIINSLENSNIEIAFIPNLALHQKNALEISYLEAFPILVYQRDYYQEFFNQFIKRTFDIIFSFLFTIFVLSWLVPIMAIIIKITSKGPIFYLQQRIGLGGKTFKIIKFRSMYTDSEKAGPLLAKDYDPRVTPIGRIMRKYRIDELPQFLNVLKGDMSIVGPRPERKYYIDEILKIDSRYSKLHSVRPGITSIGQVYFGYAETVEEMVQRLRYDLLYLDNNGILSDLKIIYLTMIVVIKGKGK